MSKLSWAIIVQFIFVSCSDDNESIPANTEIIITVKPDIITQQYTGNGVQWGGYDILEPWTGSPTLSDGDWNTLFERVRFMRPPLVRIMVNNYWNYMVNNEYNPLKSENVLVRILDFCEQEGITVILGEWGHTGGDTIDHEWLGNSADFLKWLIETRGFSCIRYFNMVNEPNGNWSSTNGNYALWIQLAEEFYSELEERNLTSQVKLTGPDIAVWNTDPVYWVENARFDLGSKLGAYDIHAYPTETEVAEGDYKKMIEAFIARIPSTSDMIMSEFGFKYKSGSGLDIENRSRIADDPYASDDSNMMTYDAFYGIDMCDAIMQNMLAGYAGMVIWNLDDAMYNIDGSASTKLKRWGFWNILGSEKFENAEDENIRPWFHPVSLMCRYFPKSTAIHEVTFPVKKGLRAIAGVKDGKHTIAIVNSNIVSYTIDLAYEEGVIMNSIKKYRFLAGKDSEFTTDLDENGFATPYETNLALDFSNGKRISMSIPPQSFWLYTNME